MKKIFIILIGILLIGTIFADDIIGIIKEDKIISKEDKILLDASATRVNLNEFPKINTPKLICSNEKCNPIIINMGELGNINCLITPYEEEYKMNYQTKKMELVIKQYTNEELEGKLDDCINNWLDRIILREEIKQKQEEEILIKITDEKEITIK